MLAHLLFGRKAMTTLDSILKSRDITFQKKVHLVKALIFPVVMYGCERWTIKKAESRQTDAFELYSRRLLRVPWTARRSNQSILKEISPEYSLEGLMLKLKLQSFGHLMWRTDSLQKNLMLVEDWRQEEKGTTEDEMVGWHHQLNGHGFERAPGVGDGQGGLTCCSLCSCEESGMTEQLNRTGLEVHLESGRAEIYSWKESCNRRRQTRGRGRRPEGTACLERIWESGKRREVVDISPFLCHERWKV